MYKLSIVPPSLRYGQEVELTGQEDRWQIASVTGFNPPAAAVNVTRMAGQDGARFNSEYLGTRNVVITMKLNSSSSYTVAQNRIYLEDLFQQKEKITMKYTGGRSVMFSGYVDKIECVEFSQAVVMQISIICPDPYLYDQTTVTYTGKSASVQNTTTMPLGMLMKIKITSSISALVVKRNGNEAMRITYAFQSGDEITINTRTGSKSVALKRSGVTTNLFPYLSDTSTFPTIQAATTAATAAATIAFFDGNNSSAWIGTDTTIETQNRYVGA